MGALMADGAPAKPEEHEECQDEEDISVIVPLF